MLQTASKRDGEENESGDANNERGTQKTHVASVVCLPKIKKSEIKSLASPHDRNATYATYTR